MFTRGLSKQTQENLAILRHIAFVEKYYLGGGTALSVYYGHRFSHDLDFFSQHPVKPFVITAGLKDKGRLEIFQNEQGTFNGILNGVKLSFFIYPYKMIRPFQKFSGVKIASIEDIACMKLDALSSRGTKRDFIDLYTVCQRDYSLQDIFQLFHEKYQETDYSKLHILKSLIYFEDAEGQEMPQMIGKVEWDKIKEYFLNKTKGFLFPAKY